MTAIINLIFEFVKFATKTLIGTFIGFLIVFGVIASVDIATISLESLIETIAATIFCINVVIVIAFEVFIGETKWLYKDYKGFRPILMIAIPLMFMLFLYSKEISTFLNRVVAPF